MTKNYIYILFGIVFFTVGAYLSWQIQAIKIDKLKNELQQCVSANENNQKIISMLQLENKKANKLCAARLGVRKRTLKRLQEIEKLGPEQQPGGIRQEGCPQPVSEVRDEELVSDPILFELNRMFR